MLVIFSLILLLIGMPLAFADTSISHMVIVNNQISFTDDEFISDDNESIDVSEYVLIITEHTVNIGDVEVDLTHQLEFVTEDIDEEITIVNSDLTTVTILITDETLLWAPDSWNDEILTPTEVEVTGTIPSGFQTPDSVIQIGSEDVVLVFDKTVTIELQGVTEQTAYRLPGETTWNLISTCEGTYDSPTDPEFPNECSISNGEDTKIITFHFTEFGEFEEEEETKSTSSSKGGGGRIGKFPSTFSDNSHSNEKSASKQSFSKAPSWTRNMLASWADSTDNVHVGFFAAMSLLENNDIIDRPFSSVKSVPSWVKGPTDWWSEGLISDEEFVSIIQYCYDEKVIVG